MLEKLSVFSVSFLLIEHSMAIVSHFKLSTYCPTKNCTFSLIEPFGLYKMHALRHLPFKTQLKRENSKTRLCNCMNKQNGSLHIKFLEACIVYKAEVSTEWKCRTFYGTTDIQFKSICYILRNEIRQEARVKTVFVFTFKLFNSASFKKIISQQ